MSVGVKGGLQWVDIVCWKQEVYFAYMKFAQQPAKPEKPRKMPLKQL